MTNIVIRLGDTNIKLGVAGNAEAVTWLGALPDRAAGESVLTRARHAFHGFRGAGVEAQSGGQDHANGFFRAIGQCDGVADAFAIEIDAGLGADADAVEFGGNHVVDFKRGRKGGAHNRCRLLPRATSQPRMPGALNASLFEIGAGARVSLAAFLPIQMVTGYRINPCHRDSAKPTVT